MQGLPDGKSVSGWVTAIDSCYDTSTSDSVSDNGDRGRSVFCRQREG